ncbi:LD-carboxypeptidase [Sphingomonas bacterium]|uniref:LD-carboxypeptidase n=1 Tax=Sphingomonas bacterium TaxID=1895847 RepID=UPI0015775ABE|nr:LD-carboxypeptidase [Sphingomonas bacterium]
MKIGIVAPASRGKREALAPASAFAAITHPDADLIFSSQCWEEDGHFAGSDASRAAAFLQMANDPAIDAIWFLRGGYGSNRLLTSVMPQLGPAAWHKAYCGYSDVGFLLGALYARRIGRPVHGPMVIDSQRVGGDVTVARSLGWLVSGDRQGLEPGLDGRPAAAFNLSILGALIGTPWMPDLADHVLLIEDVSEPLYNIDRLLWHMAHATQLRGVAGVRLGAVSDIKPNDPPWGEPLELIIQRWCGEMGVPYLGRALIGHTADNHVVPFGVA